MSLIESTDCHYWLRSVESVIQPKGCVRADEMKLVIMDNEDGKSAHQGCSIDTKGERIIDINQKRMEQRAS